MLHAGREADRSGECCNLAQRGMAGRVGRNSVHVTQNLKTGIATINNSSDGPPEFFSGIFLKGPLNLGTVKPLCALISRPMNNILLFFFNQKHHKIHENSCAKIQI